MSGVPWLALAVVAAALGTGIYLVRLLDGAAGALVAGQAGGAPVLRPAARAALLRLRPAGATERPDALLARMAPAAYLALAASGLALVPWSGGFVPVASSTSIVVWGAVEVLATVVIFLQGWAPNAPLPLLGAYRYVAVGLSYILISMFVLIAAALPAESLDLAAVVAAQGETWNVLSQPLGLPLFLVAGLGVTFWGPLDFAQSPDLAGGVVAETAGPPFLLWNAARSAMLVAFAAVAATVFLGGWQGPWLPGPVWLGAKTLLLLAVLVVLGRVLVRVAPERFVGLAWLVLLPASFAHLAWAGVLALPGGAG